MLVLCEDERLKGAVGVDVVGGAVVEGEKVLSEGGRRIGKVMLEGCG